jgi:hypothetical protein
MENIEKTDNEKLKSMLSDGSLTLEFVETLFEKYDSSIFDETELNPKDIYEFLIKRHDSESGVKSERLTSGDSRGK